MKFDGKELGLMNWSIRLTEHMHPTGSYIPRQVEVQDMEAAMSITKALNKATKDGMFIDADLKFTTAEKTLILKYIERPWDIDNVEIYKSLKAKLA